MYACAVASAHLSGRRIARSSGRVAAGAAWRTRPLDRCGTAALDALVATYCRPKIARLRGRFTLTCSTAAAQPRCLFEHVHGVHAIAERRWSTWDKTYADAGLIHQPRRCHYLPAVLEFVSTQPPRQARAFLGEIAHIPQRRAYRPAAARRPLRRSAGGLLNWPASMCTRSRLHRNRTSMRLGRSPRRSTAARLVARRAPTHRKPCISSATAPSLKSELPNEPHSQLRLRDLSLHLPERILRRQPDPVRPGSIHLEERFLANAAHGPVALGQQPVPCRRAVPVFGHFIGMLTPHAVYDIFISAGTKQLLAMVSGGIAGVAALVSGTAAATPPHRSRAFASTQDQRHRRAVAVPGPVGARRRHGAHLGSAPRRQRDDARLPTGASTSLPSAAARRI